MILSDLKINNSSLANDQSADLSTDRSAGPTTFLPWIDLFRLNLDFLNFDGIPVGGWSRVLDSRDRGIIWHTLRVTQLAVKLARIMNVQEIEVSKIFRGALLHDIGKLGIPDHVLLKPGPLNAEEWKLIHQHPTIAFEILSASPVLQSLIDIPYCHHESMDGSGYPRGLKGEEIPFSARLFSVVDVWDALTSDRPYRKAWSPDKSLKYIEDASGRQFDPQVVNAFLYMISTDQVLLLDEQFFPTNRFSIA